MNGDVQEEKDDEILRPKGGILWGAWVSKDMGVTCWPKYGPDFGIERDTCLPDWVCHREHSFRNEHGPCAGFDYGSHEGSGLKADETRKKSEKMGGQDEITKDSFKTDDGLGTQGSASSGELGKVADDTEGTLRNEINAKSGVVESDKGGNKTQTQTASEKTMKPVLQGQKDQQGCMNLGRLDLFTLKRKKVDPNQTVPNDGPKVTTPVTATGERLDLFTSDEKEILADIEPIMHSIHKILHQNG